MDISRKRTINTAMDIILMFCCGRSGNIRPDSAPQKFASLQYHPIQKEHSSKCRSYKKEKEGKKEKERGKGNTREWTKQKEISEINYSEEPIR